MLNEGSAFCGYVKPFGWYVSAKNGMGKVCARMHGIEKVFSFRNSPNLWLGWLAVEVESGFPELHGSYKDAVDYGIVNVATLTCLGVVNTNEQVGSLSSQNPMQCIIGGRAFQSVPTT